MGNWTQGCMTQLKAAGKLVKTWDPGTLVPRLGDFQERQDEWKLNFIHCWGALRCLQTPEWKFLSCCPSSLSPILSAVQPPCSSRKAIFKAVSSVLKAQWGNLSCFDPRRQSCRWWLTHSQLRIQRAPSHSHNTDPWQPGYMNLHSQQEAFSPQPSGNLDKCPIFPQGTPGLTKLGFEISLDEGDGFPLWCFKRPWSFKGLE